jgi:Ca2+/Na+ antiporter
MALIKLVFWVLEFLRKSFCVGFWRTHIICLFILTYFLYLIKRFEDTVWNDNVITQDAIIVEENGREEGTGLIETSPAAGVHAWSLLGTLLNRVCFILFVLVYLFMFVRYFT